MQEQDANVQTAYPLTARERGRWIAERRGAKNALDPAVPYAFLREEEIGADGTPISTLTVLLTNKECPFRCLMCDLWQNTLDTRTAAGMIPAQILYALDCTPPTRQIKLYNAGSFFDPSAIPPPDDRDIAVLLAPFERVIVECHPAFLEGRYGERCLRFRNSLHGRLEVAIGLETVHPAVLDRLNKRFTVEDFARCAAFLKQHHIDLRVFLLVRPPYMSHAEGVEWARRSLDFAFECGATACTLIPTRGGNGAMEALSAAGLFTPPDLRALEAAQEYGLGLGQGRVFADTWDLPRFYTCACSLSRADRLQTMNRTQAVPPPILCDLCGA